MAMTQRADRRFEADLVGAWDRMREEIAEELSWREWRIAALLQKAERRQEAELDRAYAEKTDAAWRSHAMAKRRAERLKAALDSVYSDRREAAVEGGA